MSKELERARLEMRGPYMDPAENRNLRHQQRKARMMSKLEDGGLKDLPPESPPQVKQKTKVIPVPQKHKKTSAAQLSPEEEKKVVGS